MSPRRNTSLEAEGAEVLVLGNLLIRGIQTHTAARSHPGYDLLAVNTETKRLARIQVKSRWQSGKTGVTLKSFDADFVVFVQLNRDSDVEPSYFVVPMAKVQLAFTLGAKGSMNRIEHLEDYRDDWDAVRMFLSRAEA